LSRLHRAWLGVLLALTAQGCTPPDVVEIVVSEVVPTVVTVRVAADHGSEVRIEVVDRPDLTTSACELDDGWFEAVVLGLKPDTAYELEILIDGEPMPGEPLSAHTGSVPSSLPAVEVTSSDPARMHGGFVLTSLISHPAATVILDADGQYVWWYLLEDDDLATTRAHLARDGRSVLMRVNVQDDLSMGIHRISLDGTSVEVTGTCADEHHDFVELPDGTLAVLCHDAREVDGEEVIGDRLVEVAVDGSERDLWFVWDHWDYLTGSDNDPHWGYAHCNAVDYSVEEDAYYVSARKLDTLFRIERSTGDVTWRFGGDQGDFQALDGVTTFPEMQHQFHRFDDRLLVFDNGSADELTSRAVEYRLDLAAMTAEQVWSQHGEPPLYCYALGDVSRLSTGRTGITWSTAGRIEEVAADGERVWSLDTRLGNAFGYTTWLDDLVHDP